MKATYIDHMGTDLSVVNAARVSFGKKSEWETAEVEQWEDDPILGGRKWNTTIKVLSKADQGLIQFLARGCTSGEWDALVEKVCAKGSWVVGHKSAIDLNELQALLNHIRKMPAHWSPFAHTAITLHLKMPIFVARQIMKHTAGMVYNEVSRRYVDSEPEFYVPEVWRKRADNVKQGSEGVYEHNEEAIEEYEEIMRDALRYYHTGIAEGIAPEQVRMLLPQSMYTEVIATGNLYAWANLFIQRTDSHAQRETQELAQQIGDIIQPLYPVSWEALTA